jgi:hypothetical protein
MKHFKTLILLGLVLSLAVACQARAAFKSKVQMIETAEVIAVVEITNSEKVSVKGAHWTYSQKATASVESVVKGSLPGNVFLYGDENFRCARCRFNKGRYLVFLHRDGELLTGNNWHLSVRKITGTSQQTVEWFDNENKDALLSDVLSEISAQVSTSESSKP